ncbi:MAG: peptidoglycan DD-metalloendopeptidase family protein [Gammaproteobacteria bacterium]|nr:peptidoglycan DD-metalloendopeptidase family protein [Gammaproteobacteria bacterium]
MTANGPVGFVRAKRLRRRPLLLSVGAIVFLALLAGAFVAGGRYGSAGPLGKFTLARWKQDLATQQAMIDKTRATVGDQVAALATRVGRMQAQLTRLDALGRHLTEVAKLDRGEFDFDQPPAVGGPRTEAAGEGPVVPSLVEMLDTVEAAIDDRGRQLTALQNLIMTRELAQQIVPGGRPVESGYISSLYGQRTDPFDGDNAFHSGLDFAGTPGTRVLAVADGIVSHAGVDGGYGRIIEITHGNGYVTRYAHNAKLLVAPGQTVKRGEPIALMGSTGRSTGTHLHFEVLRDGRSVDPLSFVRR